MKHLDLFSGIGGFSLAASWVWGDEHEIVGFCEIDKFCQKVLKKHWPDVPIFEDVRRIHGTQFGTVDLITGGFPCQPFSAAGKRKGKADDRHLWPEYLRLIQEIRPRWVLGENVSGIIGMELDTVLSDLEGEGYTCEPLVIPACAVNAPHRRDRVWIVAHSISKRGARGSRCSEIDRHNRREEIWQQGKDHALNSNSHGQCRHTESTEAEPIRGTEASALSANSHAADTKAERLEGWDGSKRKAISRPGQSYSVNWEEPWLEVATRLCRVDDGVSDRVHRLKALGNAIVPQVAYQIMLAMKECENQITQSEERRAN